MKRLLFAFGSGALFSVGLALSGMTQPQKVVGFLDFTGAWDPSLALVMGAALAVYVPGYFVLRRLRSEPVLAPRFVVPRQQPIDARLVGGAALFGIGWGLAGFCPGPALTSLAAAAPAALAFVPAMLVGALVARWVTARRAVSKPAASTA